MDLLGNLKIEKTTNTLLDMRNSTGGLTTSNTIDLTYKCNIDGINRSSFLMTGRDDIESYKWRTGTQSIQTWGNSGDYRIDELKDFIWHSRLFIGSNTGNVGIGTHTPDSKLHVVGSIKMVDGNEQNDYVLTSDADGVGSWQPWTGGIDKFITGGTYNDSTEKIELTTNTGDVIYVPVSPLVDYDDQTLDLNNNILTISKSNDTVDLSAYVNQPNLWTESGANIYRSSNVGIGITNPTAQLTVNRTFSIENTDFNNSTSTGSRLLVGLNGTNGDTFSYMQAQDAGGTSNNNLILQRYGGNVGIGTTSPTTALSVGGDVSVTSDIYLDGHINMPYVNNTSPLDTQSLLQTTTRKAVIAMDMDGDDSYLEYGHVDATQTYTQFRLRDNTEGDRFRIYVDNYTSPPGDDRIPLDVRGDKVLLSQDGGNVGIGTDSPTHRLHVEGSIKIVDGTQGLDKVLTSDANGLASWQTISVGDTNTDTQDLSFSSPTLSLTNGGNVDLSPLLDDTNLWTESGANIYRSSKVGIGTSLPAAELEIQGDSVVDISSVTATNGDSLAYNNVSQLKISNDNNSMTFFTNGTNNVRKSFIQVGHNSASWAAGVGILSLNPFGGNVGIGTTSPGAKLTLYGTNLEGWDSGIKLTREGGGEGRIVVDWDGMKFKTSVAGDGYYFRNNSNTTNLFIADGGNVGIGTTSPDTNLHVAGSIKITGGGPGADKVLTSDANGLASWQTISVGDTNTDTQDLSFNNPTLSLTDGGSVDLSSLNTDTNHYLDSASMVGNTLELGRNGGLSDLTVDLSQFLDDTNLWTENGADIYRNNNVGIGTANPTYRLDIKGSTQIVSSVESSYGGSSGIRVKRTDGDEVQLLANYTGFGGGLSSTDALRFGVNGNGITTPSMYIETDGNVGIGTTSPDTNLHVEGGIKINDGTALTNYVLTATDNNGMAEWKYNPTPIVIYATTELELIQGFQWFDSQNVAGIIKLGNDIQLSSDLTLDFQDGIELWGGDNEINSSLYGYKVIIEGTKGVCRNVVFQGNIDLAQPSTESQPIIDINGPYLKRLTLVDCTFSGVVGHSDYTDPTKYVINIEDTATDFLFFMSGIRLSYGSTASGYAATKDVDSFRIALNCRLNGLSLMCSDWVVSYGEKESLSTKWEHTKQGTLIRFDSTINKGNGGTDPNPQFKRKFAYDQSVTWDPSSRSKDRDYAPVSRKQQWLDPYPTFWGPTTTQGTISPQSGNEIFGNPGDIYHKTDTGDLYMKHTSIGTNPQWIQIGGDTNTDEQDLSLVGNTLNITNGTSADLSKYEQTLSFNNSTNLLSISDGNNVDLSSINTDTNYYLNSASMVGNTLTLGRNGGLSNVTVDLSQFLDNTNLWTENGNDIHSANSGNVGINNASPSSNLHISGSTASDVKWSSHSSGDNLFLNETHNVVFIQLNNVDVRNVVLPLASSCPGRIYTIKLAGGEWGTGQVSVSVSDYKSISGDKIDRWTDWVNITSDHTTDVMDSITLQSGGGTAWWIISHYGVQPVLVQSTGSNTPLAGHADLSIQD